MPSIKKNLFLYGENNDDDKDDDNNESNIVFLKEVFTIDDFLNCEKTKYLLEQDYEWKHQKFEEELYNFYTNEITYCKENLDPYFSNIFCNFNKLFNIINKNIKKEYDLNVFYENTELAQPLIDKFDDYNNQFKIDKKKQIAEKYNNKCKNKDKKFNWNTKTHYS